jgi:hypothetical protein
MRGSLLRIYKKKKEKKKRGILYGTILLYRIDIITLDQTWIINVKERLPSVISLYKHSSNKFHSLLSLSRQNPFSRL